MAYIDRDKVLKAVEKMDRLDKETKTKYEYDKEGFLLLINSAPTADVVEVVRCKDCGMSRETEDEEFKFCMQFADTVHSQAFCSYGERKEVE